MPPSAWVSSGQGPPWSSPTSSPGGVVLRGKVPEPGPGRDKSPSLQSLGWSSWGVGAHLSSCRSWAPGRRVGVEGRRRRSRGGSRDAGRALTAPARSQRGAPRRRRPRAAAGRARGSEPGAAEALPPQTAGRAAGRPQHPVGAAGGRGRRGPRGAADPFLRARARAGRGPQDPEEGGRARRRGEAQTAAAAA